MHQFRQYVILMFVLLGCAASVIFGIRQLIYGHADTDVFSVAEWTGYKVPKYTGPAVYHAYSSQGRTVSMPMVSTSSQALFHHNAGGSYYSQSSATIASSSVHTPYKVYQTSSSTVHSIGGGGGSAGGTMSTSGHQSANVSGSGASGVSGISRVSSFSVPSVETSSSSAYTYAYSARPYAYNNIGGTRAGLAEAPRFAGVSASSTSRAARPGIRQAKPTEPGTYDTQISDDGDWVWDEEEKEWVNTHYVGETRIKDGKEEVWDGENWVLINSQAQPGETPIGDVPWILFLLLAAGYAGCRKLKTIKETSKQE